MNGEPVPQLAARHLYLCQRISKETDYISRMHWVLELKDVEDSLRHCTRSEATKALLAVLKPYVEKPTDNAMDRASALRTWRFLESLFEPASQRVAAAPVQQEPLPEDLEGLIGVLRDLREERRRQAMATILGSGPAAIPELSAALFRHSSPLVQARILYLLAMLGDVSPMLQVWQMRQEALTSEVLELLEMCLMRMGQTLEAAPQKLPVDQVVLIFASAQAAMPALADSLARALAHLARTAPTLELRAALPYLKRSWLRSLSEYQKEARRAIETATRSLAELPVPAAQPATSGSLPVPSEAEIEPANLPQPTRGELPDAR